MEKTASWNFLHNFLPMEEMTDGKLIYKVGLLNRAKLANYQASQLELDPSVTPL
jgi:hypothetical protein